MNWLAIAAGGALGSLARHAMNHVVHTQWFSTRFPAGTVVVNITGCFAIGVLAGLVASERLVVPLHWREFLFVGLLGGFTTYSTFGLETFLLARTQSVGLALANVAAHVAGGLLAVWAGYHAATLAR